MFKKDTIRLRIFVVSCLVAVFGIMGYFIYQQIASVQDDSLSDSEYLDSNGDYSVDTPWYGYLIEELPFPSTYNQGYNEVRCIIDGDTPYTDVVIRVYTDTDGSDVIMASYDALTPTDVSLPTEPLGTLPISYFEDSMYRSSFIDSIVSNVENLYESDVYDDIMSYKEEMVNRVPVTDEPLINDDGMFYFD